MASALIITLTCSCGSGERMLSNCTSTDAAVCWPCDAGFACLNGLSEPCAPGLWSPRGSSACSLCSLRCPRSGEMAVLPCRPESDKVCVACPNGHGCDENGRATQCPINTFSNGSGVCVACGLNTSSPSGSSECSPTRCAPGEFASSDGGGCQRCPSGFGCDAQGVATECRANWFSSDGRCVACDPNAVSPARSGSSDQCVCNPGYVKTTDGQCSACKSGTVWRNGTCVLCDAGYYCVGKVHRDLCPIDTYSARGSAVCSDCRPFSGCVGTGRQPCTDASNCTCDPGYIMAADGACRRCPTGTMQRDGVCVSCDPGYECQGGNEVRACGLGTYSQGNQSKCSVCTDCKEIVAARCNVTTDSVCAQTTVPLAVVTIYMTFKTHVDGETFAMFALIFVASLPRTRLVSVCGDDACYDCFQGVCPTQRMKTRLSGPVYQITAEARFNANKLYQNLEVLAQGDSLREAAAATMSKLTDLPFSSESHIQHQVICPGDMVWDKRLAQCYTSLDPNASSRRTWVGLVVGIAILAAVAVYGGRRGVTRRWIRVQEVSEEQ